MPLNRPAPRGSRYSQKKIDPKIFYVAYEGAEEEKEYFSLFASRIQKRFAQNVKFVAVDKSSTDAEPVHVLADLEARINDDGIKNNSDDIELYIVIDTDHHFKGTHTRETVNVLQQCRQKGIKVALTNPCFEVWLMCHFEDLTQKPEEFKAALLENKKITRHNTFAKVAWSEIRDSRQMPEVLKHIEQALNNENKLNSQCENPQNTPPDNLYSGVGQIFREIKDCGISIS
ncbi:RloB family protein [Vibrio parahaemolyticus]|uniref:RloB family protein n=1 Tax=Vibrio parahaemolyticus TaxID=670 RepID=UPI001123B01D|nr:RloB family protein [Vibrio parahaemolyticus]TOR04818.1 hypothetical protein CGG81_18115 [Vibrio parahaemolyticus]HCM0971117.1 RloB domain-containing protein [Vibrio parahaemolyticus]